MALQRRLPEDDQWVVPHNILLAVYSPSSANVLCVDPNHGADQARGYAGKDTIVSNSRVHNQSGSETMGD